MSGFNANVERSYLIPHLYYQDWYRSQSYKHDQRRFDPTLEGEYHLAINVTNDSLTNPKQVVEQALNCQQHVDMMFKTFIKRFIC